MARALTLSTYLENHPIADAADERLLARAAAEVLAGDGRSPTDDERAWYEPYTPQVDTPLFDLVDAPLEPGDVAELDPSKRNTIYAICQVLARADGDPDPRQRKGINRLQAVLDVDAVEAELLEHAARDHILETAPTTPMDVRGLQDEAPDDRGPEHRRHRAFREQRADRLRARHSPRRHTSVHGPSPLGVFGSVRARSLEKG